jgi:putative alpha-1,2-mannosidase
MVTRRRFIQGSATALALLGTRFATSQAFAAGLAGTRDASGRIGAKAGGLTRYVDPFIGTGGHGHTYPGAALPFGMVQLSPDTNDNGWDACSGYHEGDGSIMGFSRPTCSTCW